ncbi:hypothetical protein [Kutzneria buriramensis]|uniref:Secreted protein n=1 Tax=Kutzneria buriramensis TaxID=1045776 RepID=A0A3E0G557_9PSEU|nr:hypothetical protein [Kutzneria buriramensis]REH17885.1 hypothetical protein BCF44_1412 [Kutzneria buriramensis]
MRKSLLFSVMTGALLVGFATQANAATPGVPSYYQSQGACQSALNAVVAATGRHDYFCLKTIGGSVPGPWVLVEGPQGG